MIQVHHSQRSCWKGLSTVRPGIRFAGIGSPYQDSASKDPELLALCVTVTVTVIGINSLSRPA